MPYIAETTARLQGTTISASFQEVNGQWKCVGARRPWSQILCDMPLKEAVHHLTRRDIIWTHQLRHFADMDLNPQGNAGSALSPGTPSNGVKQTRRSRR